MMKVKILSGYKFLWARTIRLTENIFPKSMGYLNPIFYFDEFFVAFLILIIFCYALNKNNQKLNWVIYLTYLVVCIFSILSSIVFYKYEVPINLAIINQIDSLFTMRTSIDVEIMENYRLIIIMSLLLLFSIMFPVLAICFKNKFEKRDGSTTYFNFKRYWAVSFLLIFSVLFIIKSSLFGMDILTDTPLTTLSKSFIGSFRQKITSKSQRIPDFNDQFIISSNKKKEL